MIKWLKSVFYGSFVSLLLTAMMMYSLYLKNDVVYSALGNISVWVFLSLTIGTVSYIYDITNRNAKRKRIERGPLSLFIQDGFTTTTDKDPEDSVIGWYNRFQVEIRYDSSGLNANYPGYIISVYFNPRKEGYLLHEKIYKGYDKKYSNQEVLWGINYIVGAEAKYTFSLRKITYDNIVQRINFLI